MDSLTPYPRRWWSLGVLCVGLLVISVDNTIVNVALPTLARVLSAGTSELQWIVDAYILVFGGLLITAGNLGDRIGRRRMLLIGCAIVAAGSLATLLVSSAAQLIVIRAVMGVGGACIMPTTLSVVTNIFPDDERPRAIAVWAGVAGLGLVIGPVTGGWLLEHAHWSSVFLINVPVAVFVGAAALLVVPETRDPHPGPLDPVGAALSIGGLAALLYGIIEAPTRGWDNPATLAWTAAGCLGLVAFIAWEMRSRAPMLDVRLFLRPRFGVASLAMTLDMFASLGTLFFATQYLQFVLGYSPLEAGLALLPVAAGVLIGAALSSRLLARTGAKLPVAGGLLVMAVALWLISGARVDSPYAFLGTLAGVVGIGGGLAMTPATDSIMGAVPKARAGVGSAMNDTTRQVGGALGVAVLGSVLSSGYQAAIGGPLQGLPPAIADPARGSIGAAAVVATQVGGPAGQLLLAAARSAFVDGMATSAQVGALVMVTAALLALFLLPARAPEQQAERPGRPIAA